MASDDIKQAWKVPEPTLRRLPWYLAFVKLMKGKGEAFISSTQIAKEINVDPSQVAKDLSFVNISGKTRVGYDINALVDVLEDFLGFTSQHKAFLFGVGSLGASLLHDTGLSQYGLEIVAGFDEGGIKALWNFTPFRIRVPEHIVVQNTSMYAHLAVMFNRLNSMNH